MDLFMLGLLQKMSRGGGKSVSQSSSYTINNTVDYPIVGLNLYGKSTQNGTPTPEAPIDIVSVGDNGFDILSQGDNDFVLISCRNSNSIITKQPASVAAKNNETVLFAIVATGSGLKYQWQVSTDNGKIWANTGSTGSKTDTVTIKAISSWNGKKYRCVVTDENGKSVISNEATLYVVSDDCEIKTASIAIDDLQLYGIPVDSDGNYTDSNGQEWVCDELIYNADGTGKIIKKCNKIKLAAANITSFVELTTYGNYFVTNIKSIPIDSNQNSLRPISNTFEGVKFSERTQSDYLNIYRCFISDEGYVILRNSVAENDKFLSLADMKNFVDSNDVYVIYPLAEPQEIELTAADVSALMQLQTYNGMTNISNSDNADMDVKYCIDKSLSECVLPITIGLQKQIDELRDAILSLGGNV